jgi:predicted XRE-type DNA-binding protein
MLSCVIPFSSNKWNDLSSASFPKIDIAPKNAPSYNWNMAKKPEFDWYLESWLRVARLNQARLSEITGWGKRKTSELVTGKQRYSRDTINEAASALSIRPFELLLHPADAMAIRRLRETAIAIAADNQLDYTPPPSDLMKMAL